ncbi:MAG: T9SS type A sorting domain-containing protein [Bacteroidota bacterium]
MKLNSYYDIITTGGVTHKLFYLPDDNRPLSTLTATFTTTYTSPCQNTGTATVAATGGTAPYTYQWYYLDNGQPVLMPGYTTASVTNLAVGTYQCVVTDAYGYTVTVTLVITYDPNVVVSGMNYISGGTHTNETKIFEQGFIVKAGTTVTLNNCNYQFMPGAKVIVEQGVISENNNNPIINVSGGVLILDATTFKSVPACNNRWQGIEVRGNRTAHQATIAGKCAQGKLITRNNSTIQDAICAVALWQPDNWNTTGGIINASNTWFTNNTKSLHALEYDNYVPTNDSIKVLASNVSSFTNCNFNITSSYIPGSPAQVFYKHVDLSKVNGFKFRGCDFSIPPGINSYINLYNMAIGCYNAGFQLDAPCTNTTVPCTNYDRSNFNNFYTAIYAANTGVNNFTFSVVRANFTNNAIGIYVNGVKNESILFNNFYLGPNYGDDCAEGSAPSFGINMLNSNGFAIEENTFQKASGAPLGQYVGIRCKDSKTEKDVIYKNQFTGLSYGNYAEGENRPSGSGQDLKGLQFQCNLNQNNAVDFIVAKDLTISNPPSPFIHTYQGKPELEAGNTFSANPIPEGSFMNKGTQVINYFYRTNPPVSFTPLLIVPIDNAGINTCPSHYEGGDSGDLLVLSNEAKLQKETDFASNLTNFNNVKALFDNLKDGGNTDGLKLDVETSWPTEMWNLRAELLEKSPYLSQEVLMAAADKTEVLPESILFEILSANPDELRKEELLAYLENKEQPLPDYLISILRQLAGGVTYKTILLQDMAKYKAAKSQAVYDLIRSCLNDTVTDHQYLRSWLDNLHSLNADMQIVSSFIEDGDYTSAETLLDMIPTSYELEGAALSDFNNFKQLMLWQISLAQQGRTIIELDSSEIVMIENYAATDNMAGKIAKGILEFAYGFHYCNCLPGDSSSMKSSPAMKLVKRIDNDLFIEATPNPANTWVTFDYKIPDYAGEPILQISDMKGNWVKKFTLTSKQGQQVWDVRDIQKGAYFYVLQVGNLYKSGKLIIE